MLVVKREKDSNDDSITSKMVFDIQKPMDNGIIPTKYAAFSEKNIDDSNYDKLWESLQKIEERYKKKINYRYRYEITDWESELCYEQGRFIENVEWTGKPIIDIPDTQIPYCTYSKMKYQQLKYYLYWRSCFRKGETIDTGYRTFYYLCVYELLAEFGPFSPLQRLEQLERLYKNFKSSLSNAHWIREYADFHGLEIQDNIVKGWADWGVWGRNDSMYEIIQGNYAGVFDVMYKKSAWKFMKNSFIEKTKCVRNIAESVVIMMPKLEKLFADAGIIFTDFLVGKMKKVKHHVRAYEGSVWNDCVVSKFGIEATELVSYEMIYPSGTIYITDAEGNIKRKTNTYMNYCDPYLSEYILKYTEMLFRKEVGYNFITMPTKLKGALKVKFANGYEYVLSADEKLRRDEKIYFTLYDGIERIIISSVKEYMNSHPEEIATIKERFSKEDTSAKLSFQKKKIPVEERMIEFISESTVMDTVMRVCNNSGIMKGTIGCKQVEYDLIERDQRVDKDSIEKARMVLKKNQERLVVDNELFTEEKKSGDERDFLRILLDGGEVRTKINELEGRFVSVSLLIESINNKAIEEIGDSIIEEGDEPYLVEDYLIEAKELLEK